MSDTEYSSLGEELQSYISKYPPFPVTNSLDMRSVIANRVTSMLKEKPVGRNYILHNYGVGMDYTTKEKNMETSVNYEPEGLTSEESYLSVLHKIRSYGKLKEDRTGVGTISTFGETMRFDLSKGFPLLTTKKIHWKSVVGELLFFLEGGRYSQQLEDTYGVSIWKEWPGNPEEGTYIPYGKLWRDFGGVDQIAWVIEEIKVNPDSRRLVVSVWNPPERAKFVLDPCHTLFQFYVEPLREGETRRRLSCQLYQRSADMFLGVPFNIASYALLTHMIAQVCDLDVGEFVWTGGDCHIYTNHFAQVEEQLARNPRILPKVILNPYIKDIDYFTFEDIALTNYHPHPAIKGKVAV